MLRTATVRGWQPQAGALSRACLATLLRVRMMGMLASEEKEEKGFFIRTRQLGNHKQSKKVFCFIFLFPALYKPVAVKYPSVNHNKMPEPEWRSAPQRISEKKSAENTHASAIVL